MANLVVNSLLITCILALLIVSVCSDDPDTNEVFFDPREASQRLEPATCDCDLENKLHFVNLLSREKEHSVRSTYTIDLRSIDCDRHCVVFGKLPSTPDSVHQGNWSIDREGTIAFEHRPHKTGEALLNITIEDVSDMSNYTAHTTYRVHIEEEPDWPIVFASQTGVATNLTNFDDTTEEFKNVTFSVEQNTGNNTVYADLLVTAGAFDYDANEDIRVEVLTADRPRLGQIVGGLNGSSAGLLEPLDCDLADSNDRLRNRSLTEWDASLPVWHPCNLTLPYPADELSWFAHLMRYRPGLQQSGIDRFVLTYVDKYGLRARLHVHVHVLQNPCVNGGRCLGPAWDPGCASLARSSGFYNNSYQCRCETGWVGERCEIDFDDCSSSPCPSPYVCVDKFRGFDCVCPENLAHCQPILKPWQLSATILGILAGICAVAAVVILASQRAPVVLTVMKPSPAKHSAPPDEAIPAAETENPPDADAIAEFNNSQDEDASSYGGEIELPEPATIPTITYAEAEVQADDPPASPVPSAQPPLSPLYVPPRRPLNPPPPVLRPTDAYQQSFHRGSILIPRRRPETVARSPEPFIIEEGSERGSVAGGDDREVLARGGGAGSPSDAWRLRELRRAMRNRQAVDEF